MNLEKIIGVRTKKTIYKDGEQVIKLFNQDYNKAMVLNEALNQARVEQTNLPVPQIISVTKIEEKWAIVSEYIRGVTLSRLMQEEPSKTDEFLELFIHLQIKMHNTKPPMLNDLFDKLRRRIEQSDLIATRRYDLRLKLESMPKQYVICHGDFVPSNIIIKNDHSPYILDWSHATLGNPLADVANTYLILTYDEHIKLANKYLVKYCEITNTDPKNILDWVPLIAASALCEAKDQYKEFLKTCL